MTTKQIKDFAQDSHPADTDLFLKSNLDGGVTTINYATLKSNITSDFGVHKLLTSSDDLNKLTTPGAYFVNGSQPSNWPEMLSGYQYAEVIVKDVYHNLKQEIITYDNQYVERFGGYDNVMQKFFSSRNTIVLRTDGASNLVYTTGHKPSGFLVLTMKGLSHVSLINTGSPVVSVTNIAGNYLSQVTVTGDNDHGYRFLLSFTEPMYDTVKIIG